MSKQPVHTLESAPEPPKSRGDLRREAFLKAALEVFLEQGYDAASMAEIVNRAGGSLTTLYNQFGDKQGLFLAMIRERTQSLSDSMMVELSAHTPIESGLTRIAEQFVTKLLEPQSLELYRLLIGLGAKHGEVAVAFQKAGPDRVSSALAQYLADRAAKIPMGEFTTIEDLTGLAEFLVSDAARLITGQAIAPDGGVMVSS